MTNSLSYDKHCEVRASSKARTKDNNSGQRAASRHFCCPTFASSFAFASPINPQATLLFGSRVEIHDQCKALTSHHHKNTTRRPPRALGLWEWTPVLALGVPHVELGRERRAVVFLLLQPPPPQCLFCRRLQPAVLYFGLSGAHAKAAPSSLSHSHFSDFFWPFQLHIGAAGGGMDRDRTEVQQQPEEEQQAGRR